MLDKQELQRYSRHILLPELGIKGQEKLKNARLLVIGAGGLGSPLLLYLTAAGIGTIGIVDFDLVDTTNLQRQIIFGESSIGINKTDAAFKRLTDLNPHINFVLHNTRLTSQNALDIIKGYDLVADGSDNFATHYLVNDACILLGKPLVFGSIYRFQGQVSVFNWPVNVGPNYRCLYPVPPKPDEVPSCSEAGVLGVLPGMIGSMQANEVIKIVTGIGKPLSGRVLMLDALTMNIDTIEFEHDEKNPLNGKNPSITQLIDYQAFCNFESAKKNTTMIKEITVAELKKKLDNNEDFQLIDVREPHEFDICNLNGELIPMGTILDNVDKVSKDKAVVVHCRSGARSASVIMELQKRFGFTNLYNLKGGITAWAKEIDTKMPTY